MARDNNITIIGNLTRDPELRFTQGGAAVTDIGVAWNENVKGRRNVQVILRDDDGNVLDSRIIKTNVLVGESNISRQRLKRMLGARVMGESTLPVLESTSASA